MRKFRKAEGGLATSASRLATAIPCEAYPLSGVVHRADWRTRAFRWSDGILTGAVEGECSARASKFRRGDRRMRTQATGRPEAPGARASPKEALRARLLGTQASPSARGLAAAAQFSSLTQPDCLRRQAHSPLATLGPHFVRRLPCPSPRPRLEDATSLSLKARISRSGPPIRPGRRRLRANFRSFSAFSWQDAPHPRPSCATKDTKEPSWHQGGCAEG